jgi:esterase/lipase
MAKNNKKQYSYYGMPFNRNAQLKKAKSLTITSGAEPTVDTFSNIQSSNDIVRPSNDIDILDEIRPGKKSFNVFDYSKQIFITVSSAIILGIGSYLIFIKIQLSLLEKDFEKNTESINSIETKQDKIGTDINQLKNGINLINYRLDKIEDKKIDSAVLTQ